MKQPYKERLIDMLKAKGMAFPASPGLREAIRTREIPKEDIQDLIYGRKRYQDKYPARPGMEQKQQWP